MKTARGPCWRSGFGLGTRGLWVVIVTVLPVLLIGYSLVASLRAPETDLRLLFGTLLITAVASFVIWDLVRSPVASTEAVARTTRRRGLRAPSRH